MAANRNHPLLDEDFATDKTKKTYSLYVYAERMVASGRLNENEEKMLLAIMERAKQAVTSSSAGQKKKKSAEEKISEYKEASLALRNELADEEICVAKLRSNLESSRMSLNVIQASIDRLQALCRSLSIEANAVSMDNQLLESEADKERIHWNKANAKLTLLTDRMNTLCMESPKMKDHQEKQRIAANFQLQINELEEEIEKLKTRNLFYIKQNAEAKNVNFTSYVRNLASSLTKFLTNMEKFQSLLTDIKEARRSITEQDERDQLEMSFADLDDTACLLQYAEKSPPEVNCNEFQDAVPQEETSNLPMAVEPTAEELATSEPYTEEPAAIFAPSQGMDNPILMESDVNAVLDLSANAADPGSAFLMMMDTGKGMEFDETSQPTFLNEMGAAGDSSNFNFGGDFNAGASEDAFPFNFGQPDDATSSQYNFDTSQPLLNFGNDTTGDGGDFFHFK